MPFCNELSTRIEIQSAFTRKIQPDTLAPPLLNIHHSLNDK